MAPPGASRALLTIGMVIALNKFVDFTNKDVIMVLRGLYIVVGLLSYFAQAGLKDKAVARNDTRKVWKKKEAAGGGLMDKLFGGANKDEGKPVEWEETTVLAVETKLAEAKAAGAIMASAQPIIFSMLLNIHLPLGLQLVLTPLGLYDDPVVRKYVIGPILGEAPPAQPPAGEEGPYGERYDDPTAGAPAAVAAPAPVAAVTNGSTGTKDKKAAKAAATTTAAAAAPAPASASLLMREAIASSWESSEPLNTAAITALATDEGKHAPGSAAAAQRVNVAVAGGDLDGAGILHVAAGSAQNGLREVGEMLALGAAPFKADAGGDTPLHWAAFHGCAAAVEAYGAAFSPKGLPLGPAAGGKRAAPLVLGSAAELAAGLALRNAKGQTPLETAVAGGAACADVAAALRKLVAAAPKAEPKAEPVAEAAEEAEEEVAAAAPAAAAEEAAPEDAAPAAAAQEQEEEQATPAPAAAAAVEEQAEQQEEEEEEAAANPRVRRRGRPQRA